MSAQSETLRDNGIYGRLEQSGADDEEGGGDWAQGAARTSPSLLRRCSHASRESIVSDRSHRSQQQQQQEQHLSDKRDDDNLRCNFAVEG